jgi:NAD(P)-dependent dehydrogenase (short-subunit alcohol dehydrogenase family)
VEGRLDGKVAMVTGASRGIGKGIALELGAAGATVFVTGRTVTADDQPLPGTVGETAAEIDSLGGRGVALACDHHVDAQVEAVFEQVRRDSGRLDVLVNNVFSSPAMVPWLGRPFWELPIEAWDETIDIGVRSHYVASRYAVPLLFAAGGGVIVNVSSSGAIQYAHNVPYGVGKAAVDKMTADMAHELATHAVAVVSVWPGLVRTELVSMGARETEDGRQVLGLPGEGEFDLADAESPRFTGRAVVALATDRDVMDRSGRAFPVAGLADDYGFTDVDGGRGGVRLRPEPDGG